MSAGVVKKSAPKKKGVKADASTPALYGRVSEILQAARNQAARSVNTAQVVANWLIGREIVEDDQRGQHRAGYGAKLLTELSSQLTFDFGRGYSVDNLEAFRQFYIEYPLLISEAASRKLMSTEPTDNNSDTLSRNSADLDWVPGILHSGLSWSHYRHLLRIGRSEARAFYEIEAIRNAWSVRELSRQTASLLYDRLAKSKDKKGLMRLATKGHEVVQPIDVLKDPVIMEFLDLPASPKLVESKLEQALVSNLQTFLLELGKTRLMGAFISYPLQKFDSDTERRFAVILERDADKWFKPAKGQFQLFYKLGVAQSEYVPDFVVETVHDLLMVETKARNELGADGVKAKAEAGALWCKHASDHARSTHAKPWTYLLVPHDQVTEDKRLADYLVFRNHLAE